MTNIEHPADPALALITAELEAEHEAIEQAALEGGDPGLPPPPDGEEPPLPDALPGIALAPVPAIDEPDAPAEDLEGEPSELSDDEVAVLFGAEELEPGADAVEDDDDYDPLTSKPAGFR